jgi:hypothetical protein
VVPLMCADFLSTSLDASPPPLLSLVVGDACLSGHTIWLSAHREPTLTMHRWPCHWPCTDAHRGVAGELGAAFEMSFAEEKRANVTEVHGNTPLATDCVACLEPST